MDEAFGRADVGIKFRRNEQRKARINVLEKILLSPSGGLVS